ncbi:hypothetical protein [Haloterrigena salifodinae]|uniref:hypothetical protein n=1 Tax=Haloterrigena salifodinae TaxID=2675099 RepID=UPI00201359E8|nr:hypothetical protein [Haloterrigena salifodinae]
MKQVVEASKTLRNTDFSWTQRRAYEKAFQELETIDADDDDEEVQAISDWIVQRICDREMLERPGRYAEKRRSSVERTDIRSETTSDSRYRPTTTGGRYNNLLVSKRD